MPDKWKKMPKGWTDESRKKFWNSLTSRAPKHKVTQCIKQMEGKVDDPGAFCASLADRVVGKGWRSEKSEKKSSVANSPRPTCMLCVKKHLGQAAVLFQEALQGYPAHRWIAIGHLAEAEAESQDMFPEFAEEIRRQRKMAESGEYVPPCLDLLQSAGALTEEDLEARVASRVAQRFASSSRQRLLQSIRDEKKYEVTDEKGRKRRMDGDRLKAMLRDGVSDIVSWRIV